jgi:hypothetical protein
MLEERGSATVFPEGRQLGFERKNAYFSMFPNVSNTTFVPNSSIELNGTSSACVGRKLSMLESGGPSTLFLNEN